MAKRVLVKTKVFVVIVLVAAAAAAGWFFAMSPYLERQHQLAQDYSVATIANKDIDAIDSDLQAKTHWTIDTVRKMTITDKAFVNGEQAHYVGYVLAAHGDSAKALEAYTVAAQTLPNDKLTVEFYIEYGELAQQTENTAIKEKAREKAKAVVDASSVSAEEKATQRQTIERQLGDE